MRGCIKPMNWIDRHWISLTWLPGHSYVGVDKCEREGSRLVVGHPNPQSIPPAIRVRVCSFGGAFQCGGFHIEKGDKSNVGILVQL